MQLSAQRNQRRVGGASGEWEEPAESGRNQRRDFVRHWIAHATPKPGHEWEKWFGSGQAPNFAVDLAACWVNNPRDMIWIQNELWWGRQYWNNGKMPSSDMHATDPVSQRVWWGWNEVPVDSKLVNSPHNWDGLYVKLPAAICGGSGLRDSLTCLSKAAQYSLEKTLQQYIDAGLLVPGEEHMNKRPGSYVVIMKEQRTADNGESWETVFFCQNWTSPTGRYAIRFAPTDTGHFPGFCYLHVS